MSLTAAVTITVYFVGLVNFSAKGDGREVVAPRATTAITRTPPAHTAVTLEVHQPEIVISGLVEDGACGRLGGVMVFPGGRCRIFPASGRFITLPTGTPTPLDTTAHVIPKLKTLCSDVSGIKREYLDDPKKYGVRLDLTSGVLTTCRDGAAWSSKLVLGDTNGKLTVEDRIAKTNVAVTLADGATIHLLNRPTTTSATSGKEHFWWHYVIAENATACIAMPTTPAAGDACPAALLHDQGHGPHPAASGLGCSNSQYP